MRYCSQCHEKPCFFANNIVFELCTDCYDKNKAKYSSKVICLRVRCTNERWFNKQTHEYSPLCVSCYSRRPSCKNCHEKPRAIKSDGTLHDRCSKSCVQKVVEFKKVSDTSSKFNEKTFVRSNGQNPLWTFNLQNQDKPVQPVYIHQPSSSALKFNDFKEYDEDNEASHPYYNKE